MKRLAYGFACVIYMSATAQVAAPPTIEGLVFDWSGVPLAGATVAVPSSYKESLQKIVTDDRGRYLVTDMPTGRSVITISLAGFVREEVLVELGPGDKIRLQTALEGGSVDFHSGFALRGNVRDEKGKPIAKAQINIVDAFNERHWLTAETDSSGRYTALLAASGQYTISAYRPGFLRTIVRVALPAKWPQRERTMDFTLTRAPSR